MNWQIGPLDRSSALPVYEQIIERFAFKISSGELVAGDPLPSVQQLAVALQVNPNTAARAIRTLRELGLSVRIDGVGTAVSSQGLERGREISQRALRRDLAKAIASGRGLHLSAQEMTTLLEEIWNEPHDRG